MIRSTKHVYLPLVLLCGTLMLFTCCKTKSNLDTAQKAFDNKEYSTALELFKKTHAGSKAQAEKTEATNKIAETYVYLDDYKNAETWYKKAIAGDKNNAALLLGYARVLKANEKYKEALDTYEDYTKITPADEVVEKEIQGCRTAEQWKTGKTRYVVLNEKTLNTSSADYAPAYGKKGILYFSSDRTGGLNNDIYEYTGLMYSDIYQVSYKKNTKKANEIKYEKVARVEGINSKYNDGVNTYDAKSNTIIYTICNDKNGKGYTCKLYSATYEAGVWSESQLLPFCSDSFNAGQPTLNKEGTILYFSSDMPGGLGGKDLYSVAYNKKTKSWGEPQNMGSTINTPKDEAFPFIFSDGTLYFSSNGHAGMGMMDIFYTRQKNGEWTVPVNMKGPINSGADDFCFIMDETRENGYFSSNREGGKGKDDVYRFYMTPLQFNISGVVRDKKTNEIIANSTVKVFSSKDSSFVTVKTDEKGVYRTTLTSNSDYRFVAGKPEDYYLDSKEEQMTTKGFEVSEDFTKDFYLEPLNIEDEFTLEGIYYDVDKADLREASKAILDTLILTLNKYPKIKIEIGSHTDCRSDSTYNQQLSARRAQSVVDYLIEKKINKARLEAKGYGESRLVNDCACEGTVSTRICTEEEHQLNRRTTFKILSKNYLKN